MTEYRLRFTVVTLALFFAIEIIAATLLIPSYVISIARIQTLTTKTAQYKSGNIIEETANLNMALKEGNLMVAILSASTTPRDASISLEQIIDARSSAIKITGIVYHTDVGVRNFNIQGIASTREDLLTFTKKLQEQPKILKVDLPVSNFTQPENIKFSINVTESL